ncbi:hypothetical protein GR7B_00006 [Vibrio phage vB_VcorM_GR7B]|nr:hypothetical protein GR7B_00006 [Vibrio phage vB_VcorM_GR7B]
MSEKYFQMTYLPELSGKDDLPVNFTESTAPTWLTSEDTVKGSTMDGRWFWDEHVLTLDVGQSVDTDFRRITRIEPYIQLPHHPDLHPSTAQVIGDSASAVLQKLYAAQVKYGLDNGWKVPPTGKEDDGRYFTTVGGCIKALITHLKKGDIVDSIAYLSFLRELTEDSKVNLLASAFRSLKIPDTRVNVPVPLTTRLEDSNVDRVDIALADEFFTPRQLSGDRPVYSASTRAEADRLLDKGTITNDQYKVLRWFMEYRQVLVTVAPVSQFESIWGKQPLYRVSKEQFSEVTIDFPPIKDMEIWK